MWQLPAGKLPHEGCTPYVAVSATNWHATPHAQTQGKLLSTRRPENTLAHRSMNTQTHEHTQTPRQASDRAPTESKGPGSRSSCITRAAVAVRRNTFFLPVARLCSHSGHTTQDAADCRPTSHADCPWSRPGGWEWQCRGRGHHHDCIGPRAMQGMSPCTQIVTMGPKTSASSRKLLWTDPLKISG